MYCTDIASVYTSKTPADGPPQKTESIVSHGGQYLRGMSVPGDVRMIHTEDHRGMVPQHYGYSGEDRRSFPQIYSHAGEDRHGVPQYYGDTGEDRRGVPQHYSHGREDHRGVPQHCSHTLVHDRESPVL